ncbi:TonB-dependent siderophore receptor [Idiomarina sp. HP20-50]|uniref:TonB-dependent siderophore receptor n=1 Tax=Idiomarina sp. HP20-50 TaxID=3070813 RepID=UPI003982AF5B
MDINMQPSHYFRPTPIALFCSVLMCAPAFATDKSEAKELEILTVVGTQSEPMSYKASDMSTATGMNLSFLETPQSVTAVTAKAINDQQLNSVIDVMTSVAGVNARPSDNDRYSVSARGISVSSILYDGVPTTYDTRFNYGDNLMDSALYERVEIVRGATGLMLGAGSPSAAINLVRKRPTTNFQGNISISGGSWDMLRSVIDLSGGLNQNASVRGRIVLAYQDKDSWQDRYEQQRQTLYGILEADLGTNTLLTLGSDFQHTKPEGTMSGGLPLFYSDGNRTDYDRHVSTAPSWASAETNALNSFVTLEHHFNSDWRLKGSYIYGDNSLEYDVLWPTGNPDPVSNEGMIPGSMAFIDGSRTQHTIDLKLTGSFNAFGRNHQLVAGTNQQEQNFANPYYSALGPKPTLGDFSKSNFDYPRPQWSDEVLYGSWGETTQQAVYVASQLELSTALSVVLGGRLDNWETDQDNFGATHDYKIDNEFTGYLGLTYALSEAYALYANYTDIFTPQSKVKTDGSYLDPIKGINYEAGIKATLFGDALDLSLAGFEIRQDNVGEQTGETLPNSTIPIYRGVDDTQTRGFEFEANGSINKNWDIYLGYTQFETEDPYGERINTINPEQQLKLFTGYEFDGWLNGLRIGAGVNWQSHIYNQVSKPDNSTAEVEQGSYALVKLMARYKINKQLSLRANLDNALDKSYYSQLGFYNQFQYGAPRNFSVTLSYRF